MSRGRSAAALLCAFLLAAALPGVATRAQDDGPPPSARGEPAPPPVPDEALRRRVRSGAHERLEGLARAPPEPEPVTGEAPPAIVDTVVADLMARLQAERSALSVVETQAVVFNDGALGCPEPGQVYTQASVRGYRVVLARGDERFDYRVTERGLFRLCHGPAE
jgi:hypothetical protein